jgi:iron(III) transport system ATP-binding protein
MAIRDVEFLGSFCRATLDVGGKSGEELIADFSINLMRDFKLKRGTKLNIALPKDRLQVFGSNIKGASA